MRRRTKVLLGVLAVLVLALAGAAAYLLTPPTARSYDDPVSVEQRSQNSALYATLAAAGIDNTTVVVTLEQVTVAYELPNGTVTNGTEVNETAALAVQRFVTGAAANAEPRAERLVILQVLGGEPRLQWTVQMDDFREFMRGEITLEELEEGILAEEP